MLVAQLVERAFELCGQLRELDLGRLLALPRLLQLGAERLVPRTRFLQLLPQRLGLRAHDAHEARGQFRAFRRGPRVQRRHVLLRGVHQISPESSEEIGRSHSGQTMT